MKSDLPPEIFDPWTTCERMGVEVIRVPLRNARGYTDGSRHVWLHDGLNPCEERTALTHELVHITQGHNGRQPQHVEDAVAKVTARWLVPWHHILAVWGHSDGFARVATDLCVTIDVVQDRLTYATCEELLMLEEACVSYAA